MRITEVVKVYVRHKEEYPETVLMATALEGFHELGIETVPFYGFGDVEDLKDLGPTVGVCGYIGDAQCALRVLGRPMPPPLDYPKSLLPYLGRSIRKTRLGEVRASTRPVFVKPVEQKRFTGFVWEGAHSSGSRRRVVLEEDSLEVWVSDVCEMQSEYRAMVLNGEILDVRRYKGDWSKAPDRQVVESAVSDFEGSGEAPCSYTLDFAVSSEGRTLLVEANDGYAFGPYGMLPILYANCLASRWEQLAGGVRNS